MKIAALFLTAIFALNNALCYDYAFTQIPDCKGFDRKKCTPISSTRYLKFWEGDSLLVPERKSIIATDKKKTEDCNGVSFFFYKREIATDAQEKYGVSDKTIDDFLHNTKCIPGVKKKSDNQPERTMDLGKYMKNSLSIEEMNFIKPRTLRYNVIYDEVFNYIEKTFGVERSIVMALIAHETKFGNYMGIYKIADALATNGFNKKSEFFSDNLMKFLFLVDQKHVNINSKGSFAGAFGIVQFMPQTFMSYAMNYEGSEKIDLFNKFEDAAVSLANYLYNLGWRKNDGIATEVILPDNFNCEYIGYMAAKGKTVKQWKELGIRLGKSKFGADSFRYGNKKAWVIIPNRTECGMQNQESRAFLVYENFGHLMDWNRSMFFGITVAALQYEIEEILLSESIKVSEKRVFG